MTPEIRLGRVERKISKRKEKIFIFQALSRERGRKEGEGGVVVGG